MAILFDHLIEVRVLVNVLSVDMDGPDYKTDVLTALKEEIAPMETGKALEYEILETTRDEY